MCLRQGFYQALFFRTLSSGLYFPLFDLFQPMYRRMFAAAGPRSSSPSPPPPPATLCWCTSWPATLQVR